MYLCPCILVRQLVLFLYVSLVPCFLVYQSSFLFVRCILSPSTFISLSLVSLSSSPLFFMCSCILVCLSSFLFALLLLVSLSTSHLFSQFLVSCLLVLFSLSPLYPCLLFLFSLCALVFLSIFVLFSFCPLFPCFLVYWSSFLFVPCILVNQSSFLLVLWHFCLLFLFSL